MPECQWGAGCPAKAEEALVLSYTSFAHLCRRHHAEIAALVRPKAIPSEVRA